jgi:hypothetical protein
VTIKSNQVSLQKGEMAMLQENELPTLVVLESSSYIKTGEIENDTAITLLALASDDPSSWEEAISLWPRYRTPAVCEFASILPLEETDRASAMHALFDAEAWIVINFDTKQIFTGGQLQEIGRDAVFFAFTCHLGGNCTKGQRRTTSINLANRQSTSRS